MYKWNLCLVDFSYAWQGSCITAQSSPTACTTKSWDESSWQQTLNIKELHYAHEHDLPVPISTLTLAKTDGVNLLLQIEPGGRTMMLEK